MSRFIQTVLVCFTILAANVVQTLRAQERVLTLPFASASAAFDTHTGRLWLAGRGQEGGLWFIDTSEWGSEIDLQPKSLASEGAQQILIKHFRNSTYGVVVADGGRQIATRRLSDGQILHQVPLAEDLKISFVSVSENDHDPWVYVTCQRNSQMQLAAFSLRTPSTQLQWMRCPTPNPPVTTESRGRFVVSASGWSLYQVDSVGKALTQWTLRTKDFGLAPPRAVFQRSSNSAEATEALVRLPLDQGLLLATDVRGADLVSQTRLKTPAETSMKTRHVALGTNNNTLRWLSTLDGRNLASQRIPFTLDAQLERPLLFIDEKNRRVFVVQGNRIGILPVDPAVLRSQTRSAASAWLPPTLQVGKTERIQVAVSTPGTPITLQNGPAGMRFEDGEIVWKPTLSQLGAADFWLRIGDGEQTQEQLYTAMVVSRQLHVPFDATDASLDSENSKVLVWGAGTPACIALLSTKHAVPSAQRKIQGKVLSAGLSNQFAALVTTADKDAQILLLDLDTLSTVASRPIPIESNTRFLAEARVQVTDRAVEVQTRGNVTWRFSVVDLQEIDEDIALAERSKTRNVLLDSLQFCSTESGDLQTSRTQRSLPSKTNVSLAAHRLVDNSRVEIRGPQVGCGLPISIGVAPMPTKAGVRRAGIGLVTRSLTSGDILSRMPLEVVESTRDVNVRLVAQGTQVIALVNGQVYLRDLPDMGNWLARKELRFSDQNQELAVSFNEDFTLTYDPPSGVAPHANAAFLGVASHKMAPHQWLQPLPEQWGSFTGNLGPYLRERYAKIATTLVEKAEETAPVEGVIEQYLASIRESFVRLTLREPTGVPVVVPINVFFLDAEGTESRLRHFLLTEIPAQKLHAALTVAVSKKWPGTVARIGDQTDLATAAVRSFSERVRRRTFAQSQRIDASQTADDALAVFEQRWEQQLKQRYTLELNPYRRWQDPNGKQFSAQFQSHFAGHVYLRNNQSSSRLLQFKQLAPEDQQFVLRIQQQDLSAEPTRLFRRDDSIRRLMSAMSTFSFRYPPTSLWSKDGKESLLSWRVMILPALGCSELYQLFRLDEPWDSPHNRKLIPYMPSVFQLDGLMCETGHTAMLRLTGPDTASPQDRLLGPRDIKDPLDRTLFAVFVRSADAVPWTKPTDLPVDSEFSFIRSLWWKDGHTTAITCDGQLTQISRDASRLSWSNAIQPNDANAQ